MGRAGAFAATDQDVPLLRDFLAVAPGPRGLSRPNGGAWSPRTEEGPMTKVKDRMTTDLVICDGADPAPGVGA